jgi:hydroxymethylpyrimidine kinase / phosphomethylpyrimidine kinase / thiamine-phosphate diphosphorylase
MAHQISAPLASMTVRARRAPQPLITLFATSMALLSCSVIGLAINEIPNANPQLQLHRPIVYTIAGSDSGGGAGIQADLHAMHAFGCHGCSAITCLTAQNSVAVTQVHTPPTSFLQAQLEVLLTDMPPSAIKIGMLGNKEIAELVGGVLKSVVEQNDKKIWVVLDPVMISTSGSRLMEQDAHQAMIDCIFPFVDILTPNKIEAETLLGRKLETLRDVEQGARDLLAMGVSAVLIKGGHLADKKSTDHDLDDWALDFFLSSHDMPTLPRLCDGPQGVWLRSIRYETQHTHGTGCTLSACIASALALGEQERSRVQSSRRGVMSSLLPVDACCLAKAYVTAGIYEGVQLGKGPGPVAHTTFPQTAHHYPSIVLDPSSNADELPFRRMLAFGSEEMVSDDQPQLGRIMPIVDSVGWIQRFCRIGGVKDLQLRVKNEQDPSLILEQVQKSQALCQAAGIRLWINDHWEAAVQAGCFGVHLGQEDLYKCAQSKGLQVIRSNRLALGISTHSFGELSAALALKPSYVSLGPVFPTSSKRVQFDPQGLATVSKWRALIPASIPLVCIGGIGDAIKTREVCRAGADCVALIGAVTQVSDLGVAVSELTAAARKSYRRR